MRFNRLLRNEKPLTDHCIGKPLRDLRENLEFARSNSVELGSTMGAESLEELFGYAWIQNGFPTVGLPYPLRDFLDRRGFQKVPLGAHPNDLPHVLHIVVGGQDDNRVSELEVKVVALGSDLDIMATKLDVIDERLAEVHAKD